MQYALILVLIAAAAVMSFVGGGTTPSARESHQITQAQWVVIYGQAALGWLHTHPGYSGAISDAQMQSVLGASWANLPAAMTEAAMTHGALISAGKPYAWAVLPSATTASALGDLLRHDLVANGNESITINENGTLVSPQLSNSQPAPVGIPDNAIVVAAQ
jgi:hypothetical protein